MKKIIICLSLFFIIGCNSFEVIQIEGQPDECNDFYTAMNFYSATTGEDSAILGVMWQSCKQARKDGKDKQIKSMQYKINDLCSKLYKNDLKGYKKCVK